MPQLSKAPKLQEHRSTKRSFAVKASLTSSTVELAAQCAFGAEIALYAKSAFTGFALTSSRG
jgi:hypothetical protein